MPLLSGPQTWTSCIQNLCHAMNLAVVLKFAFFGDKLVLFTHAINQWGNHKMQNRMCNRLYNVHIHHPLTYLWVWLTSISTLVEFLICCQKATTNKTRLLPTTPTTTMMAKITGTIQEMTASILCLVHTFSWATKKSSNDPNWVVLLPSLTL